MSLPRSREKLRNQEQTWPAITSPEIRIGFPCENWQLEKGNAKKSSEHYDRARNPTVYEGVAHSEASSVAEPVYEISLND